MSRDFNGTTSIVSIKSSATLADVSQLTIAMWTQLDNLGEGSSSRLIDKFSSGTVGYWNILMRKPSRITFSRGFATADVERTSANGTLTTGGVWTHVAVTWDGTIAGSGINIYFDGVETTYSATTNGAGGALADKSQNIYIGNNAGQTRTADGRLAHVHVFGRVLSAAEIKSLMYHPAIQNRFVAASTDGLVGYWPFDGYSVEYDKSGMGNHSVAITAAPSSVSPPVNETYTSTIIAGCGY